MAIVIHGSSFPPLPPKKRSKKQVRALTPRRSRPALFISTNPSHINLFHLAQLFTSTNLSCLRFPNLDTDGNVEPVDPHKLRIALSHSSVVVSVFSKSSSSSSEFRLGELVKRVAPVTESNGELVGFGRAVSDNGLTASIHDVMVLPSLQRLGIGRMIMNRIIRVLTNRDIHDISALCLGNERLFFEACGFGDDILKSTTMMYTRAPSSTNPQDDEMVKVFGQMMLLVPPSKKPLSSERSATE